MLEGTYSIILSIAQQLITSFLKPSPRVRQAAQRRLFHIGMPPQSLMPFVEAYNPSRRSHAASIGFVGPALSPSPPPSSPHPALPWADLRGVWHADRYV